jgi:hypothetical protein
LSGYSIFAILAGYLLRLRSFFSFSTRLMGNLNGDDEVLAGVSSFFAFSMLPCPPRCVLYLELSQRFSFFLSLLLVQVLVRSGRGKPYADVVINILGRPDCCFGNHVFIMRYGGDGTDAWRADVACTAALCGVGEELSENAPRGKKGVGFDIENLHRPSKRHLPDRLRDRFSRFRHRHI